MARLDIPTLDPVTRGDYERIRFQLMQEKDNPADPDTPQNITGWTLRFGAKLFVEDSSYVVQKNSNIAGHFEIVDAANGIGNIILMPVDLQSITYETALICDLEAVDASGKPFTTMFYLPVRLDVST